MTGGDVTVLEATAEDVPFLKAMIWEAILASPTLLARYGLDQVRAREESYWTLWPEQPDPAFVAVGKDGRKIGAVLVRPNDEDEPVSGWRVGIGVDTEARGQGAGRLLMMHAMDFARGLGAEYMNLFVDRGNKPAIALYRQIGFTEVGRREGLMEMRIELNDRRA